MEREINGKMVETDPEGYLVNLEDWSAEIGGSSEDGRRTAKRLSLALSFKNDL